jgi:lipoprotein-anchoring transpeptidase ErfK/SrfK
MKHLTRSDNGHTPVLQRASDQRWQASTPQRAGGVGYPVLLSLAAILIFTLGCAAIQPGVFSLAVPSPAPAKPQTWARMVIPKPTQTPAPPPPAPTPTATATAVSGELPTEEAPLITMVIVEEEAAPSAAEAAPATESSGKSIVVSISEQHLYAFEQGELIYSFVASTGMGNSTRVGTFQVLDKIPSAYGANWNIWMPNWMGIYWSGTLENGIHALPILPGGARLWSGFLGTPISYGCVVLGVDEAMQLYEWAELGTPVEIRW